jgi:hypothetical protein
MGYTKNSMNDVRGWRNISEYFHEYDIKNHSNYEKDDTRFDTLAMYQGNFININLK